MFILWMNLGIVADFFNKGEEAGFLIAEVHF